MIIAEAFLKHWVYWHRPQLCRCTDIRPKPASKFFDLVCTMFCLKHYSSPLTRPKLQGKWKVYHNFSGTVVTLYEETPDGLS